MVVVVVSRNGCNNYGGCVAMIVLENQTAGESDFTNDRSLKGGRILETILFNLYFVGISSFLRIFTNLAVKFYKPVLLFFRFRKERVNNFKIKLLRRLHKQFSRLFASYFSNET